jgi:hypothetical protein
MSTPHHQPHAHHQPHVDPVDTTISPIPEPPLAPIPLARQPMVGLLVIAVVAVVFALLMIVPGPQRSLELFGPFTTYWLGPLLVGAVWWAGWPLQHQPRPLAGLLSTAGIVAAGVLFTALAQSIVGHLDGPGIFATTDTLGVFTTFPFTVPLGALVFLSMVQITFVCGRWPFDRLNPVFGGIAALALAWAIALTAYFTLANWDSVPPPVQEALGLRNPGGPFDALTMTSWIACCACWQVLLFVLWNGWPFTGIRNTAARLLTANITVLGLGTLTFLLYRDVFGWSVPVTAGAGGIVPGAVFIIVVALETWPFRMLSPAAARISMLIAAGLLSAALYFGLTALITSIDTWDRSPAPLWLAVAGLNVIAPLIILYCSLWRRWPLPAPLPPPS